MSVINLEKLNKAVDAIFVAAGYPDGVTIGRTIDFIHKRYTIILYSKLNDKELDEYKIIALKPEGKARFNHREM